MGLLRSVVDTVIANMTPEERVEAIREVAEQATGLMTADEQRDLATHLFTTLLQSLSPEQRDILARNLLAVPVAAGQEG